MSLKNLNVDQLSSLAAAVERQLKSAAKPSKALIVRTMAEQGHCSAKSTGTENTLIKLLKASGVALPPTLATVMGEQPNPASARTETPDTAVSPPALPNAPEQEPPQGAIRLALTGGVSTLTVNRNRVKATFVDGSAPLSFGCDGAALERNLRSNYILLELTES